MDAERYQQHWQALRDAMVAQQVEARGITSSAVLEALRYVPREAFVAAGLTAEAYADKALPTDCGQTISQPYIVALMTDALQIGPESRVLEIGTGSGYQTAVLAKVARQVYTIEWHLALMSTAADRLRGLGIRNVSFRCADGSRGWPEQAPFDGIIVTAGAPETPTSLCEQLRDGANLVVPAGPVDDQVLMRVRRTATGLVTEELIRCRFVKLLGAEGWQE